MSKRMLVDVTGRLLIVMGLFLSTSTSSCKYDRSDEAVQAAEAIGITHVEITDSSMFWANWNGCGNDDGSYYEMTGLNAQGKSVAVVACCAGWGNIAPKNCTIRVK